jgi:hypothetical protein
MVKRIAAVLALLVATTAYAQTDAASVAERARGASRIVVARVMEVTPRFGTNAAGDRLIFSDILLEVSETLKGTPASLVTMTIEGGAIGDLSLEVSDMPAVKRGDLGIYFLQPGRPGEWLPHQRGAGILKMDAAGRVEKSSLSLAQARALVRNALK